MVEGKIHEIRSLLANPKEVNNLDLKIHEFFELILSDYNSIMNENELFLITRFLQEVCQKYSQISSIFLSYLPSINNIGQFIDIIPSIFSISSDHQIEEIFSILVSLVESDNRNTLKVISAMIDLPLLPHLQSQLSSLAIDALASVDEGDVPSLCRTILKNLTTVDSMEITKEIRNQISTLHLSNISLIIEILWETLPSSPTASHCFISHIYSDCLQFNPIYQTSLTDVCIVLILISELNDERESKKCSQIALKWLNDNQFPFNHLITILEMRSENEAWDKMISGIWLLCRWLLSEVVRRSLTLSKSQMTYYNIISLYSQLQRLFFSLYSQAIDYRKHIIQFLYKSCQFQLPYLQERVKNNFQSPFTPVAVILSNSQQSTLSHLSSSSSSSSSSDTKSSHQHAKFSCFLLEDILRGHPTEANEVFSSLSHRIHSSFSSIYERHSIDEKRGYCHLPQPFVLHRLLRCLVTSNSSLPVFGTIQKLLNIYPHRQHRERSLLQNIFCSESYLTSVDELPSTHINSFNPFSTSDYHDSLYSLPSVGILLAGYMLKSLIHSTPTRGSSNMQTPKDILALLTWVEKQITSNQDDMRSLLYSLDILCTFQPEIKYTDGINDDTLVTQVNSWNALVAAFPVIFQLSNDSEDYILETGLKAKFMDIFSLSYLPESESSHALRNSIVVLNFRDVIERIVANLSRITSPSRYIDFESIGCDILWIFHNIGMFFVETHRQDIQIGQPTLYLYMVDLFPKTENVNDSQTPPVSSVRDKTRQKKRIVPTHITPPVNSNSCTDSNNLLLPYLSHTCDDYSITIDSERQQFLVHMNYQSLVRLTLNSVSAAFFLSGFLSRLTNSEKDVTYQHNLLYHILTLLSRFRCYHRIFEFRIATGRLDTAETKENSRSKSVTSDSLIGLKRKSSSNRRENRKKTTGQEVQHNLGEQIRKLLRRQLITTAQLYHTLPIPLMIESLQISKLHSVLDSVNLQLISHPLMTTTGLEIFLSLCHLLFSSRDWFAPGSLYDSSYTSFTSMDFEFLPYSSPPTSTSSQEQSNDLTQSTFNSHYSTGNNSLMLNSLCEIFSNYFSFTSLATLLRKQKENSTFQSNQIDYDDISLFLCVLCMSIDVHIIQPILAENIPISSSPLWGKICEASGLNLSLNPSSTLVINTLASQLEAHILTCSHPIVSICASRLLLSLTNNDSPYRVRMPSIFWFLVTTLHESNKKLLFPMKKTQVGYRNGLLTQALDGYLTDTPDLFPSVQKLSSQSSGKKTVESKCLTLLHQAISLTQVSRGVSFSSLAEQESFGTFIICWTLWWKYEQGETEYRQIYGVFLLLMEVFYHLKKQKKRGHISSNTTSTEEFQGMRRTSRVKKPVDRYQPESLTTEVGEIDPSEDDNDDQDDLDDNDIDDDNHNNDNGNDNGNDNENGNYKRNHNSDIGQRQSHLKQSAATSAPTRPVEKAIQVSAEEILVNEGLDRYKESLANDLPTEHEELFRRIHRENVDKYLSFIVSFIPTLIFESSPLISFDSTLQCDSQWGPYVMVIFSIQVLIYTISESILLINQDPSFILTHALQLIRIIKISLLSLEQTIQKCLQWRVTTTTPLDQFNSFQYLIPLFELTLILFDRSLLLSHLLTSHFISSHFTYSKKLIQSPSQLIIFIEKIKSKIVIIMKSFQLEYLLTAELGNESHSLKWLIKRSKEYQQSTHQLTLSSNTSIDQSTSSSRSHFRHETAGSTMKPQVAHNEEKFDWNSGGGGGGNGHTHHHESNTETGFRVSTAVAFGWGIYK